MKAVIIAGGFGTRLRPLSNVIPKPLIPLLDRPLISHIIDSLPKCVESVILATNYKSELLEEYFKNHRGNKELLVVKEDEPLGTGGALKNVSRYIDDTFVAFNGDIISSIDVQSMIDYHLEKRGIGTIALWHANNPSDFGVVELSSDCRIEFFVEKPAPGQARSNLINAGIYVFDPKIFDYIGENFVSLEREVFPRIIGLGLYGYHFLGYWLDCGTRENFLAAQRTLLDLRGDGNYRTKLSRGAKLIPPNFLIDAEIESATIGPYVCINGPSTIGSETLISNSLIMEGTRIGKGAFVRNSIVGPNVKIEDGEFIEDKIVA